MLVTRRVEFSASHVCRRPDLTDDENASIYGAEANPHGHGHNFTVEVTLEGEPDPATGMVFDLKKLKHILNLEIVEPFDHRFLNVETPPFDKLVPTLENMATEIWRRIEPSFAGTPIRVHAVRLYESEELYVDYFGAAP